MVQTRSVKKIADLILLVSVTLVTKVTGTTVQVGKCTKRRSFARDITKQGGTRATGRSSYNEISLKKEKVGFGLQPVHNTCAGSLNTDVKKTGCPCKSANFRSTFTLFG